VLLGVLKTREIRVRRASRCPVVVGFVPLEGLGRLGVGELIVAHEMDRRFTDDEVCGHEADAGGQVDDGQYSKADLRRR